MGYNNYSDAFYNQRQADRKASGRSTFDYSARVISGAAPMVVHPSLDIRGKIRESRDSAQHPESTPIGLIFDVTGSMRVVPQILQRRLPKFMGLMQRKAYVPDPQILMGAIGDYPMRDAVPLQIGQFESGLEMDDDINNIVLEGGGAGNMHESYQNALYFMAHRTRCDAWEKRGKKGHLVLIGDEMAYDRSTYGELEALIGGDVDADVTFDAIMTAALRTWNVYFILPGGTCYFNDPQIERFWKKYVGENFIRMEDPEAICETIGLAIGLHEGMVSPDGMAIDLQDVGVDASIVKTATDSVDALARQCALMRVGTGGSLPSKTGRSSKTERL
jgi:hypothetical protein